MSVAGAAAFFIGAKISHDQIDIWQQPSETPPKPSEVLAGAGLAFGTFGGCITILMLFLIGVRWLLDQMPA